MKHINAFKHKRFFTPIAQSRSVQAAMMVLAPGQSSADDPVNEHPKAEQWLFVISGSGKARVGKKSLKLKAGSLLLIEKGEPHRITNTGSEPMSTINFYAPPAYGSDGDVKASVE